MRFVLGLIVFWIMTFSIKIFLEKELKVDSKFSFALSYTFIGIIEFILGILNLMKIGSYLLVLLSIIYLIIKRKNISIERIKEYINNPVNLLMSIVFIYITFVGINMHLTHYDNFSHWGIIIKTMFTFDRLPNFENNYILFKGYQPGSACFIYLFGLLCGKNEGSMIVAQNYLIFGYLTVLFNYIKEDNKIFKALLLIAFYIFIMTTSLIRFNNLLVDSLIAVILIVGLLIIYNYKKDLKKAFIYSLPIIIYIFLVKNSGLLLDGIICLYLLYLGFKNKKLKESIKYVVIIGTILLTTLLIWQGHVSMVYGHWALNTKHSLSPQNFYTSLKALGIDNMIKFIKMYTIHLFDIKNNLPNIYMLVIDIVVLVYAYLSKNKKEVFKYLLILNLIYLGYYLLLGFMYIFSMPWEEAKVFAGYNRYMMTILVIIIGLFIIYVFNHKSTYTNIFLLLISVLLLLPISNNYQVFNGLLGVDDYKGSSIEKFDSIINDISKDKEIYYIYAPSSEGDSGFFNHMATYKLLKNNVYIITKKEEIEKIEYNSYLILFDKLEDYEFNNNYKKVNEIVIEKGV